MTRGEYPGGKPGAGEPPRRSREEHARELAARRAWGAVKTVRAAYWFSAAVQGLSFLSAAGAVSSASADGVSSRAVLIVAILYALQVVLYIAGAVQVVNRPLLWALLLAAAHTSTVALELVGVLATPFLGPFLGWVRIFMVFYLWAAIKPVLRLQRHLDEDPELWERQRESAEERALNRKATRADFRARARSGDIEAGRTMEQARTRRRSNRNESLRKTLVFGGGTIGVVAVIVVIVTMINRPPSFESASTSFLAAWNTTRPTEVAEHYSPKSKEKFEGYLERFLTKRDLGPALPPMKQIDVASESGKRATVHLIDENGARFIRIRFELRGKRWQVVSLGAPR